MLKANLVAFIVDLVSLDNGDRIPLAYIGRISSQKQGTILGLYYILASLHSRRAGLLFTLWLVFY
jgi:hypothetical protein